MLRNETIPVHGGGIAGLSAAQMLAALGHEVTVARAASPAPRRVALNAATLFLLERIWGSDLLRPVASHALARRILLWNTPDPVILDDLAVVVDAADLSRRMKQIAGRNSLIRWTDESSLQAPCIVSTSSDGYARYLTGGTRHAVQAPAVLHAGTDTGALHIEATSGGWLAVLPGEDGTATLMGIMTAAQTSLEALLAESRQALQSVAWLGCASSTAQAAPHLLVSPPGRDAAIRIGDAALRFDPISGDGVAGALRSAHLAVLLIDQGLPNGGNATGQTFYEQRLALAMRAHVRALGKLYAVAPFRRTWAAELGALRGMDVEIGELWPNYPPAFAVTERSLHPN